MSRARYAAIPMAFCAAIAACSEAPTGKLTEPESVTPGTADAASRGLNPLAAGNTWVTKRSLPRANAGMAAGTIDGIIYVVGGNSSAFTAIARVNAYDVATNTWSAVKSLPRARAEPNGASAIQGKLYVTGGRRRLDNRSTKTLFVYDPEMNSWAQKADMPEASCGGAQGVIAGRLYAYTGCPASGNVGVFFRYSPTTDTWVKRAAPPDDHGGGVAGVINGRFYLAGGSDQFELLSSDLHVYNPATDTWATKASLSVERIHMAAAVLDGKLFVAGGAEEDEGVVGTLEVYDPVADTWTIAAPLPTPRFDAAAADAKGRLFVIGGGERIVQRSTKVEAYSP